MKHQEQEMHEIRREVDMYFDHALSKADENILLQRVQNDPTYHRVFTSEQAMREQIRQKIHRPRCFAGPDSDH